MKYRITSRIPPGRFLNPGKAPMGFARVFPAKTNKVVRNPVLTTSTVENPRFGVFHRGIFEKFNFFGGWGLKKVFK